MQIFPAYMAFPEINATLNGTNAVLQRRRVTEKFLAYSSSVSL